MALPDSSNEEIANLFKVLSKPETLRILFLAGRGIGNSTYAIEELDISQKIYYTRLSGLVESGLVNKIDGAYRQTPLGQIICSRFIPDIECIFDSKDKLELLQYIEGIQIENGMRKLIEEKFKIPGFERSTKVGLLDSFEAFAIEAIDLYDSAKENTLLASNYMDVRVMEAVFRSTERGIINRLIVGKKSLSSELKKLRMMLSLTFVKTILNFTSSKVNLKEFVRFVDLPYTFCIVDGQHSIIEVTNPLNENFIVALSIDDKRVAEKLTDFFEMLWGSGELNTALKVLTSIGSKLNGEGPHQDSEL